MLIQSSLGAQIANLKSAIAARETCVWVPDAVHALIAAIFARIFGRLEQLILLWQAGTLPTAPIRRPHAAPAPHPAAPSTPKPAPQNT